jgi:hypothetical protein
MTTLREKLRQIQKGTGDSFIDKRPYIHPTDKEIKEYEEKHGKDWMIDKGPYIHPTDEEIKELEEKYGKEWFIDKGPYIHQEEQPSFKYKSRGLQELKDYIKRKPRGE